MTDPKLELKKEGGGLPKIRGVASLGPPLHPPLISTTITVIITLYLSDDKNDTIN